MLATAFLERRARDSNSQPLAGHHISSYVSTVHQRPTYRFLREISPGCTLSSAIVRSLGGKLAVKTLVRRMRVCKERAGERVSNLSPIPTSPPKRRATILVDINKQIAKAEKLTVQPSDYETLERASPMLKEPRDSAGGEAEVENGIAGRLANQSRLEMRSTSAVQAPG